MSGGKCPIWGTPALFEPITGGYRTVDSARAGGKYCISGSAVTYFENNSWSEKAKVLLTNWLIDQRKLGNQRPKVLTESIIGVEKMCPPSVFERVDNFLRYLHSKSDLLGTVINFKSQSMKFHEGDEKVQHELLAWTSSIKSSELVTIAEYCKTKQWVEYKILNQPLAEVHEFMLLPQGYARLAELDETNIDSSQAFVAMWFDPSMNEAYEQGITPAIEDAGYKPIRIDSVDHNNKIDDEIIAGIRRSRFLVADFTQGETGARGGVYYEAGFAHGLNIPVIFTCRKDALNNVHFDPRQYNHIVWESYEELKTRLSQRISATIGDGPNKTR